MYNFEQLMFPVWDTEIIYDESVTMVRSNGVAEASLLFMPDEIISVTSADKTVQYEAGRDWQISGNRFRLTEQSRIFAFEENEIVFDEEKPGVCFASTDGRYSLFHEGHFFHDRQIAITYKKGKEKLDFAPEFCEKGLHKSIAKLQNGQPSRIVLYGDSIAAGANSSGMTLTTPFLPKWGDLFVENLRRHYHSEIQLINTSVGGTNSYWGIENAKKLVGDYLPDLAILAFGMNDQVEPDKFVENMEKIRDIVLKSSPETEFVICATTIPNKQLRDFYHYQGEYREVLETLKNEKTVIADFCGMQRCLLERKRFIDLTGNNVNHPNDFMIRCHAQLLSAMMIAQV